MQNKIIKKALPYKESLFILYGRKGQDNLEKIPVANDVERAVLQLHKTLCDGKTEPTALRVSGGVCTHEALCQLLGRDINGCSRNIFEGDDAHVPLASRFQKDARAGEGIFADVAHEVIKNTPEMPAVCYDADWGL